MWALHSREEHLPENLVKVGIHVKGRTPARPGGHSFFSEGGNKEEHGKSARTPRTQTHTPHHHHTNHNYKHTKHTAHITTNTTPPTHEISWTRNAVAKPLHRKDDGASLSRAASSTLLDRVQEFHPQDFQWVVDMMQQCLPFTQHGSLPWFCRTSPSLDAHPPTTGNIHCCVDLHGHLLMTSNYHTPTAAVST